MAELELPETMHVEEAPEQEGERQLTEREKTMAAIAEHAEQRRQEEIAQGRIYDEDANAAGLTYPDPEPEPELADEIPVQDVPSLAVDTPKSQFRMVNVDGQQIQVTDEQYDQLARMGMLANQALYQYQTQPQPQVPVAPSYQPPQPQQGPMVDPDLVRETVRRIQYGGEEDGAAALSRLVSDVVSRVPQSPAIDQNRIIQQAAAVAQQQAQYQRDAEIIQQEYHDTIFSDPQRTMLARLNVDAIRQQYAATGIYKTDLEIFREAGNRVLSALNLPRPDSQEKTAPQAAPIAPHREGIIERKRAAPRTTTQIDRRSPSPSTPRQPSSSEIVDRMRQARGQASMM